MPQNLINFHYELARIVTTKSCFLEKCISSLKMRGEPVILLLDYYEKCTFIIPPDHNLNVVSLLRPDKESTF